MIVDDPAEVTDLIRADQKSRVKISKYEKSESNKFRKTPDAIMKLKERIAELQAKVDENNNCTEAEAAEKLPSVIAARYTETASSDLSPETLRRAIVSAIHRGCFKVEAGGKIVFPELRGCEARWSLLPGASGALGPLIPAGEFDSICINFHVTSAIADGRDVKYDWNTISEIGLPLVLSSCFTVPRGARIERRLAIAYDRPHNEITSSPVWAVQTANDPNIPRRFNTTRDALYGFLHMRVSEQTSRLTAYQTPIPEFAAIRSLRAGLGPKQMPHIFCSRSQVAFTQCQNSRGEFPNHSYVDDISESSNDEFVATKGWDAIKRYPVHIVDRPGFTHDKSETVPDTEAELKEQRGCHLGLAHVYRNRCKGVIETVKRVLDVSKNDKRSADAETGLY